MKPLLLLLPLSLLTLPPTSTSPVTYIIQKDAINPLKVISTAILATEKIVITTKHPLSDYNLNQLCALAAPNMYNVTTYQLQKLCIPLKKVHISFDLALIELLQDLQFIYGINVAEIPFVNSIQKPFELDSDCKMLVNTRNGDLLVQEVIEATISYEEDKSIIGVTLKQGHEMCVQDNGLPLYCKDAVVGMFVYGGSSNTCCMTGCSSRTEITAIKLISDEANALLRKFIPAPL